MKEGCIPARFITVIADSQQNLKKARRGISIFESEQFKKSISQHNLALFDEGLVRNDLQSFVDLSVNH
jgi:hypothetical protein